MKLSSKLIEITILSPNFELVVEKVEVLSEKETARKKSPKRRDGM